VHATPGITRVELTRRLGISSGSAADLVRQLQRRRLIAESVAAASGRRGRPTLELGAHPQGPLAGVAVIGHETWTVCAVELGGGIHGRLEGRHKRNPKAVCADVRKALGEMCSQVPGRVRAVAVSVPGIAEGETLVEAPSLGWRDLDLASLLIPRELHAVPFLLGNDANLAALGESRRGAAAKIDSSLHIYMHSGIGGALISDGALLSGARGIAGEFGHLPFGSRTRRCRCGALGCWNTSLDGAAFARELGCAESADEITLIASTLAAAAERPGRERTAAKRVGRTLGRGIAGLVNALDPEVVILGGLAPRLLAVARDTIDAGYASGLMGTHSREPAPLRAGSLGDDAPLLGAGVLAFARILSDLRARA
jgi:predicted NBD/HSP70 family sugar kinase